MKIPKRMDPDCFELGFGFTYNKLCLWPYPLCWVLYLYIFFILGCSGLVSSGALRRGFGINRGRHYEAPFLMNQTLFYYTERSHLKPARSRSDATKKSEDIYFLWMNAWLSIMLIIHFYYLYYQIIG